MNRLVVIYKQHDTCYGFTDKETFPIYREDVIAECDIQKHDILDFTNIVLKKEEVQYLVLLNHLNQWKKRLDQTRDFSANGNIRNIEFHLRNIEKQLKFQDYKTYFANVVNSKI